MNPWLVYLFNQFDTIRMIAGVLGWSALIIAVLLLFLGQIGQTGEKIDSPDFIVVQVLRHQGFKLLPWAFAALILLMIIPSTHNACIAHPQCKLVKS